METKTLYEQLLKAESTEKKATEKRIALENEIYQSVKEKLSKTEGTETIEDQGFSITCSQPVSYKLDEEKYRVLAEELPTGLQFHRTKIDFDKTKYNFVIEQPESKKFMKKIQDCLSSKPGKIAVKVKKI
jgi:hypothetical protein